ncbi:S10 family serine carboxypeptidase-like protein [Amycolatopsis jejuensis]|uniref:S10 family serine carboxypeptidase-like protein n=1 Tax=Amycolatopsis jejuensis TaxID=330084 RepID=UPI00052507E7|nr:hypothetical protein [Amycolatopsis jejuensis]
MRAVPLVDDTGELQGHLHAYAYLLHDDRPGDRPVVFLFNGGPGSSSQWLHLGGLGPRRVALPGPGSGSLPGYHLEDSQSSLLGVADLVFLDPLGTGLSRAVDEDAQRRVYSITGDARAFAQVVHTWLAEEGRIGSPKYLLGESYGTVRAAFLARELLHGRSPIAINGIILLSQGVNLQETVGRAGNITARVTALPFMATTAWYHGVGSRGHDTAESATKAALDYAYGDYASVLLRGSLATDGEVATAAARLAEITGVPADTWKRKRLQLTKAEYRTLVLKERGQIVGTMDARYVADAEDRAFNERTIDPAHARTAPAFVAAVEQYLREELGVPTDGGYRSFDQRAFGEWRWSDEGVSAGGYGSRNPSPFNAFEHVGVLSSYFKEIADCRLFVGTGCYDTLTTVGAANHLVTQYGLPADRITQRWYEAGHLMYTDKDAALRLAGDLDDFITGHSADSRRDGKAKHG